MKTVISDPKTKKAYAKTVDNPAMFIGKKIGQEVELGLLGLDGYKVKITGGSDKQGFPMKNDMEGGLRKKVFIMKDAKHGTKQKVARRGNLVTEEIEQLNLKIIKEGSKKLEEIFAGSAKESTEDLSFKEKAVKESLANVGKIDASAAKDIKGKIKG